MCDFKKDGTACAGECRGKTKISKGGEDERRGHEDLPFLHTKADPTVLRGGKLLIRENDGFKAEEAATH